MRCKKRWLTGNFTQIRPQSLRGHTDQGSIEAKALEARLVQFSVQPNVFFRYAYIFPAVVISELCEVKRETVTPPPAVTCHLFDFSVLTLSNHFKGFGVFFLHHQNRNKRTE